MKMTDDERRAWTTEVVAEALAAARNGDWNTVNGTLIHAIHHGGAVHEMVLEIVAQTGGTLT